MFERKKDRPVSQNVSEGQPKQHNQSQSIQRQPQQARSSSTAAALARGGQGGPGQMLTPFGFVRRMMEDMDRMWWGDDLFAESPFTTSSSMMLSGGAAFNPQVEVFQRNGNLVVRADLPGIDHNDVHVHVEGDMLVIEGERKTEHEEKGEGGRIVHSERSYGRFERQIALPRNIDVNSCDASFENGVLEVTLKLPQEARRSVQIRGGAQQQRQQPQQPQQPAPQSQRSQPQSQQQPNQNGRPIT